MSIAQNLSLHPVLSETSTPVAITQTGFWKKLGRAAWGFLESTGRYHTAQAKKHGYYHYY